MIKTLRFCFPASLLLPFCGCLGVESYTLTLDWGALQGEFVYHDIVSTESAEGKVAEDFAELKKMLAEPNIPFEISETSGVLKVTDKELFREGDALSGRVRFQLLCASWGCAKEAVLRAILDESCSAGNGEVFLVLDRKGSLRTDGSVLDTKKSRVVVWPEDAKVFTLTVKSADSSCRGKCRSLLHLWLKDPAGAGSLH
ncbi:MAG: hypothetical protein HY924_13055 [Elusimicrobia bacterium]|nr:hypothetical protein [Elusimicrobiota bacterium]